MRHLVEGYRWMWGAIRRWRGGPLWRRTLLFALYLLRDLFGTGRRTAMLAAGICLVVLSVALQPRAGPRVDVSRPLPRADIGIAAAGYLTFEGQAVHPRDLDGLLAHYGIRFADIRTEEMAPYDLVDRVQKAMIARGIIRVRMVRVESLGR